MQSEVQQLVELGVAEPTASPWAFPALCVHQNLHGEGKRRMCVDFRELNARTVNMLFQCQTAIVFWPGSRQASFMQLWMLRLGFGRLNGALRLGKLVFL